MEQEKYAEEIDALTLMSDAFSRLVFKDKECTEYVINTILNRNDLKVIENTTQYDAHTLNKRSLYFDIYAVDSNNNAYNIEIQNDTNGAGQRRARYHSSVLDCTVAKKRMKFSHLVNTYVIFITKEDYFKRGKPIYTVKRKIEELDNEDFGDGSFIIYINGKNNDDTPLGKLMQDFNCKNPKKMHSEILSKVVSDIKYGKGKKKMCEILESVELKGKIKVANAMLSDGMSVEKVKKYTGLSKKEIRKLKENITKKEN